MAHYLRFFTILSALFAAVLLNMPPADASPHGFSKGKKVGWHARHVPPGWSKGRKVGWHHRH